MRNLEDVRDEIKAVAQGCDGTPTAKLVAVLIAAGVTDTKEIAGLLEIGDRAVRKVKAELQDRNSRAGGTVGPELQDRHGTTVPESGTTGPQTELQDRPHSSASRARIESPSGILTQLDIKKTPCRSPKGPTPKDALAAFEAYNATALRCALPQAAKLTPDRQRKIIARLRDYGLEGWNQALANIEKSAFLTGGTDHGFRADLDFVCQAKSFGKLHDGGYGNGRHTQAETAPISFKIAPPTAEELRSLNA